MKSSLHLRLTVDDWDPALLAWRSPALGIPSASVREARDPKGLPVATSMLKVDTGPARLTWNGPGKPPETITISVELGEELSPISQEKFWKRLAIVVPIITAIIGAGATHL